MEVGGNKTANSRVSRIDTKSGGTSIQKDGMKMDPHPPGGGGVALGSNGSLQNWHHSSRIIRVSRASGGKDRHSKVLTARGLRDRRIRLSVSTAIQFYDLQDRLGYDQPSKAVEWLIKAASEPISELPSLDNSFLNIPRQSSIGMRFEMEADEKMDLGQHNQPPPLHLSSHLPLSNSACSSNSETSKGSDLSLSRSGLRVSRMKARERAKERAVKEKENDRHRKSPSVYRQSLNTINSSFTELLTGGGTGRIPTCPTGNSANPAAYPNLNLSSSPMGHLGYTLSPPSRPQDSSASHGFCGQIQLPHPFPPPNFNISMDNHQDLHQNPVVSEQFLQAPAHEYNLDFTIASGIHAGLNRGTLQSNSPSFLPHFQRFSPADLPALPYHGHHYLQGFGDGICRHPNQEEKERN